MSQIVTIYQGDLLPRLEFELNKRDGTDFDLTSADGVKFFMGLPDAEPIIEGRPCTIINAPKGLCSVDWEVGDTDVAGEYSAEVVVYLAGRPQTAGQFTVKIQESLHGD